MGSQISKFKIDLKAIIAAKKNYQLIEYDS
jgi:hypothetical protein